MIVGREVGTVENATVGANDKTWLGIELGSIVGDIDGDIEGALLGRGVASATGTMEGFSESVAVGDTDDAVVGTGVSSKSVGAAKSGASLKSLGDAEGLSVGTEVLGCIDGGILGAAVGSKFLPPTNRRDLTGLLRFNSSAISIPFPNKVEIRPISWKERRSSPFTEMASSTSIGTQKAESTSPMVHCPSFWPIADTRP